MLIDKKILEKIGKLETTYDALRYAVVTPIPMEMAQTKQHYRGIPPDDKKLQWSAVSEGDLWGESWSSAWFRGRVTAPESVGVQPLFLRAQTGAPECMILVDGVHKGSFDANHPVRLVDRCGAAGKAYEIHLEAYAGHSYPGTQPFDNPIYVAGGAPQDGGAVVVKDGRRFTAVELVVERTEVTSFVLELKTLRQLGKVLGEDSLRRGKIESALQQVFQLTAAKPAEVDEDEWLDGLRRARKVMNPLLALKNSPTTPFFGIIGHSHIDTAWLWTVDETKRKLARTFSSVLSLMDQYPDFRFTQSAAYHSDVVRRLYPEIFERIQQRVREGRWEMNGAMWIEPDCNIPSGESLIRQCLVGQRATREMFGVTSDTLWQPDVFGYSGALPQILKGCGVKYFCTTKLAWNDTNRFPYDTFVWHGIDGSSVLSHFNLIHCTPDPETLTGAWKDVQHKDIQDRRLMSFGYGDGGGGPTAEMIEMGRLVQDLEGCPRVEYTSISEFMDGISSDLTELPHWNGELYLELHRGTLTSIAKMKRFNRQCEFTLKAAELAATIARLINGTPYPSDALLDVWKRLLVNQFHDILPGTSIAEVNDEAIRTFEQCLTAAEEHRNQSLSAFCRRVPTNEAALVMNDLSWARTGEIELTGLPDGFVPATAESSQQITDIEGKKSVVVSGLSIPSMGFLNVDLSHASTSALSPFHWNGTTLETPFAQVEWNDVGQITSFFDTSARRQLVQPGGAFNTFLLGEDVPSSWDNWDIDRDQRLKLEPQNELVRREIVASGPLQLRIRQKYRIGKDSHLTQDLVFHSATARVDFETVVDWKEKYRVLKVGFALDLLVDTARHEIQYGHLMRTTHDNTTFDRAQFDVCAHKWTDISETEYGVAFLNDCKYACTVKGSEYRLSLLKSGRHPDPRGDEGRHRFSYALLPHTGGFSVESVVRPAYEFNASATVLPGAQAPRQAFSLVSVDNTSVIVEAVKWAEDGESFIVRLYEAGKTGSHAQIKFGLPVHSVCETNMLEEEPIELSLNDNSTSLYLRPFEIKTLRCVVL